MKKFFVLVCISVVCCAMCFLFDCYAEKAMLREKIIRVHIIANSDKPEDQAQKLLVRDAVATYLKPLLANTSSQKEAMNLIGTNLTEIKNIAQNCINGKGSGYEVKVDITEDSFGTRYYDTFSLPAGVYTSVRIEIGEAAGENWWCVAFPAFCLPAAGQSFREVAAKAGFSDELTESLASPNKIQFRFYILDLLGNIENFFYKPVK